MQRLLSGQAGGPFAGGKKRQQQDRRQKAPTQHGRWSRAELQHVPQVKKCRRTVGLETSGIGMTELTFDLFVPSKETIAEEQDGGLQQKSVSAQLDENTRNQPSLSHLGTRSVHSIFFPPPTESAKTREILPQTLPGGPRGRDADSQ